LADRRALGWSGSSGGEEKNCASLGNQTRPSARYPSHILYYWHRSWESIPGALSITWHTRLVAMQFWVPSNRQ
jgi:hypothetical protein